MYSLRMVNQDCLLCLHSFVKDIVPEVVLSLMSIGCRGYLPEFREWGGHDESVIGLIGFG